MSRVVISGDLASVHCETQDQSHSTSAWAPGAPSSTVVSCQATAAAKQPKTHFHLSPGNMGICIACARPLCCQHSCGQDAWEPLRQRKCSYLEARKGTAEDTADPARQ